MYSFIRFRPLTGYNQVILVCILSGLCVLSVQAEQVIYQYQQGKHIEFTDKPRQDISPRKKIVIPKETPEQKAQRQRQLEQVRQKNREIDERLRLQQKLEQEQRLRRQREQQLHRLQNARPPAKVIEKHYFHPRRQRPRPVPYSGLTPRAPYYAKPKPAVLTPAYIHNTPSLEQLLTPPHS